MEERVYVAKTMSGLEDLLVEEIKSLGGTNIEKLHRAVAFEGDLEVLYKVNLWSRLALRVIRPILKFKAHNEIVFYKRLRRYKWTDLFGLDDTFKINSSVHSDIFTHSQYVALKTKDAILDEFRLYYDGRRPSIDLQHPDYVIDVHCNGVNFTISLDSSGESLHRRGYRQSNRRAPLNETLAAGMVLLSGWDQRSPLLDPMCGSGTILTEAYLIAKNIAPRAKREHFAFMNWEDYNETLWNNIVEQSKKTINDQQPQLFGHDNDSTQISELRSLLKSMNVGDDIKISVTDFFESHPMTDPGMMIINPPYGQRIEEEDIFGFYKTIGDTLKKKYQGWSTWILSGNKDAIKSIGLKTSKKLTLYNGSIECKYHRYDMYRGTRKHSKLESSV